MDNYYCILSEHVLSYYCTSKRTQTKNTETEAEGKGVEEGLREPVVSRTFTGADVTALVLNMQTREQYEKTLFIERLPTRKTDEYIRKRFTQALSENEKFVVALSTVRAVRRFKMTEPEFVSLAHETELLKNPKADEEGETEE